MIILSFVLKGQTDNVCADALSFRLDALNVSKDSIEPPQDQIQEVSVPVAPMRNLNLGLEKFIRKLFVKVNAGE